MRRSRLPAVIPTRAFSALPCPSSNSSKRRRKSKSPTARPPPRSGEGGSQPQPGAHRFGSRIIKYANCLGNGMCGTSRGPDQPRHGEYQSDDEAGMAEIEVPVPVGVPASRTGVFKPRRQNAARLPGRGQRRSRSRIGSHRRFLRRELLQLTNSLARRGSKVARFGDRSFNGKPQATVSLGFANRRKLPSTVRFEKPSPAACR